MQGKVITVTFLKVERHDSYITWPVGRYEIYTISEVKLHIGKIDTMRAKSSSAVSRLVGVLIWECGLCASVLGYYIQHWVEQDLIYYTQWRLELAGHTHRDKTSPAHFTVTWQPAHGESSRGRPPTSFVDTLLRDTGLDDIAQLKQCMSDRVVWRNLSRGQTH